MALATGTLFSVQASATTGNVNGAGFNTANANFLTDATATSATGSSPVISSASYNFVAGDVGAWIYIKTGTNWTPGFYKISSVASNQATVDASIGAATQLNATTNMYQPNTVAGCATTASPSGGTFGVDYSQQDAAELTATDYTAVGSSTTLTSVTGGFTRVMVGNFFHQTTTGTGGFGVVGWYEIVNFTDANTVTLDRTPNNGTTSVACTGNTGGAGRLNGLEDTFCEMLPAGAMVHIKDGAYAVSMAVSVASTAATVSNPIIWKGFTSVWGDTCNTSNRPVLTMGASTLTPNAHWYFYNLVFSGTGTFVISTGSQNKIINSKLTNTSTTASRTAVTAANRLILAKSELVSQNGLGLSLAGTAAHHIYGSYIHDSATGLNGTTANGFYVGGCIFEANDTNTINSASTGAESYFANTFYGREAKTTGGITYTGASSTGKVFVNNIFYGLGTALNFTTLSVHDSGFKNNYFNNTTDTANFYKSDDALALNPTFTGATQITGTTATTSGSVLTQSGGDFSTVTDSVDYLHVLSGTGVTTGIYLITSHTSTTLTVNNALGTSSAGDVVYYVTTGHNFGIGTNLKAQGFPSFSEMGIETVGYMDVGAVQRQEAGGSSSGGSFTFVG